jgi:hypothetical protein
MRPASSVWMNRCTVSRVGRAGGRVGGAEGEVEDAAAADRRELVAVAEQRDADSALIDDGEQGAGGVLVEHARFVDHEEISRP